MSSCTSTLNVPEARLTKSPSPSVATIKAERSSVTASEFSLLSPAALSRLRMIDLVLQREGIGAVRNHRQREDFTIAGSEAGSVTGLDIAVQRRPVRYDEHMAALRGQAGVKRCILRSQMECIRTRTIRSKIDKRGERTGGNGRTRSGDLARTTGVGIMAGNPSSSTTAITTLSPTSTGPSSWKTMLEVSPLPAIWIVAEDVAVSLSTSVMSPSA